MVHARDRDLRAMREYLAGFARSCADSGGPDMM